MLCHLEAGEVTMTCHDKWRLRERFVANQIQQGSDGSDGRPGRAIGRRLMSIVFIRVADPFRGLPSLE